MHGVVAFVCGVWGLAIVVEQTKLSKDHPFRLVSWPMIVSHWVNRKRPEQLLLLLAASTYHTYGVADKNDEGPQAGGGVGSSTKVLVLPVSYSPPFSRLNQLVDMIHLKRAIGSAVLLYIWNRVCGRVCGY